MLSIGIGAARRSGATDCPSITRCPSGNSSACTGAYGGGVDIDEPSDRGPTVPAGCHRVPTPAGRLVLTAKRFVAPDPDGLRRQLGDDPTIVCLNPERELMEWPTYPDWLRDHQPDQAWWFSMPDWNAPPLAEARILIDEIADRLLAGRTVVVHCSHGQGRTGTIAVAVLMVMGVERSQAERLVAEHRPGAGPLAGSQSALIAHLHQALADAAAASEGDGTNLV